jgi:hypothetical protein
VVRREERHLPLVAVLGLLGSVTACGAGSGAGQESPEYATLEDAYKAVDEVLNCADDAGNPLFIGTPGPTGEAIRCTETVEVFWFDSQEAYDNVHKLFSTAAGNPGSVYFVEGRNWFVVDFAEVAVGVEDPERNADLEVLAENLGAKYAVKQ